MGIVSGLRRAKVVDVGEECFGGLLLCQRLKIHSNLLPLLNMSNTLQEYDHCLHSTRCEG
jgi:hypothetical protein